jgi:hypothetical protein
MIVVPTWLHLEPRQTRRGTFKGQSCWPGMHPVSTTLTLDPFAAPLACPRMPVVAVMVLALQLLDLVQDLGTVEESDVSGLGRR